MNNNYILVLKSGWFAHPSLRDSSNVVFKTQANTLSEAKEYFVKLKNLSEEKFDELFIVTEEYKDDDKSRKIVK